MAAREHALRVAVLDGNRRAWFCRGDWVTSRRSSVEGGLVDGWSSSSPWASYEDVVAEDSSFPSRLEENDELPPEEFGATDGDLLRFTLRQYHAGSAAFGGCRPWLVAGGIFQSATRRAHPDAPFSAIWPLLAARKAEEARLRQHAGGAEWPMRRATFEGGLRGFQLLDGKEVAELLGAVNSPDWSGRPRFLGGSLRSRSGILADEGGRRARDPTCAAGAPSGAGVAETEPRRTAPPAGTVSCVPGTRYDSVLNRCVEVARTADETPDPQRFFGKRSSAESHWKRKPAVPPEADFGCTRDHYVALPSICPLSDNFPPMGGDPRLLEAWSQQHQAELMVCASSLASLLLAPVRGLSVLRTEILRTPVLDPQDADFRAMKRAYGGLSQRAAAEERASSQGGSPGGQEDPSHDTKTSSTATSAQQIPPARSIFLSPETAHRLARATEITQILDELVAVHGVYAVDGFYDKKRKVRRGKVEGSVPHPTNENDLGGLDGRRLRSRRVWAKRALVQSFAVLQPLARNRSAAVTSGGGVGLRVVPQEAFEAGGMWAYRRSESTSDDEYDVQPGLVFKQREHPTSFGSSENIRQHDPAPDDTSTNKESSEDELLRYRNLVDLDLELGYTSEQKHPNSASPSHRAWQFLSQWLDRDGLFRGFLDPKQQAVLALQAHTSLEHLIRLLSDDNFALVRQFYNLFRQHMQTRIRGAARPPSAGTEKRGEEDPLLFLPNCVPLYGFQHVVRSFLATSGIMELRSAWQVVGGSVGGVVSEKMSEKTPNDMQQKRFAALESEARAVLDQSHEMDVERFSSDGIQEYFRKSHLENAEDVLAVLGQSLMEEVGWVEGWVLLILGE